MLPVEDYQERIRVAAPFESGLLSVQAALFGAAGGAVLGSMAGAPRTRWLSLWAVGGVGFLLLLRFTAARYWLPFAAPFALLVPFGGIPAIVAQTALGLALLADDEAGGRAVERLAEQVVVIGPPGVFTGHWGWQRVLEQHGWTALPEGQRASPRSLLAMPVEAWPQRAEAVCVRVVLEAEAPAGPNWLPRAYSATGHANLHANWIAGQEPRRTVIPWTFAADRYEAARVCLEP
jgi:hypothetical protein